MSVGAPTHGSLAYVLAAVLLFSAAALVGCGDDNDDQQAANTSPDSQVAQPSDGGSEDSGDDGTGGGVAGVGADSIERIGPPPTTEGGDNSIQEFGEEADAEQTDAVAAVLVSFLRAQAKGDWSNACNLTASMIDEQLVQLQQSGQGNGKALDCQEVMAATTGQLPKSQRRKLARVQLGSVRVEGDMGFAIYKGARGWMSMPVVLEDGNWRVGLLAGVELL